MTTAVMEATLWSNKFLPMVEMTINQIILRMI